MTLDPLAEPARSDAREQRIQIVIGQLAARDPDGGLPSPGTLSFMFEAGEVSPEAAAAAIERYAATHPGERKAEDATGLML